MFTWRKRATIHLFPFEIFIAAFLAFKEFQSLSTAF